MRKISPIMIGVVIALMLILFWNMIASYEGGGFTEVNETEGNVTVSEVLINTTFWVNKGEFSVHEFPAQWGDQLNVTVQVLDGGAIDFFLMEEDKKEQFEGWMNETENRFYTYDNGKKLNTTESNLLFTIPQSDTWYIIVNNYGHMQGGAFPVNEVHVKVLIMNVGFTEEHDFN